MASTRLTTVISTVSSCCYPEQEFGEHFESTLYMYMYMFTGTQVHDCINVRKCICTCTCVRHMNDTMVRIDDASVDDVIFLYSYGEDAVHG